MLLSGPRIRFLLILAVWSANSGPVQPFTFWLPSPTAITGLVSSAWEMTNDWFYNKISFPPQSLEQVNTSFMLFTRRNMQQADHLYWNGANLLNTNFRPGDPVKFVVHGFTDSHRPGGWMEEMKDALLSRYDVNVVLVDWSQGNGFPYSQAVTNTLTVAQAMITLIQAMQSISTVPLEQYHIIGHSLGAHCAGFVGKQLAGRLGQITGLDPAGPEFSNKPVEGKLWRTDARFVDVIHTNAVPLIGLTGIGINQALGHVDFWPNGGDYQPGCKQRVLEMLVDSHCDHQRAIWYYIQSLWAEDDAKRFAVRCSSYEAYLSGDCTGCQGPMGVGSGCALMGDGSVEWYNEALAQGLYRRSLSGGRFFMVTKGRKPFFGKFKLELEGRSSSCKCKDSERNF